MAIISASAPALKPLFHKALFGPLNSISKRTGASYGSSRGGTGIAIQPTIPANRNGQIELHSVGDHDRTTLIQALKGSEPNKTSEAQVTNDDGITMTTRVDVDRDSDHVDLNEQV